MATIKSPLISLFWATAATISLASQAWGHAVETQVGVDLFTRQLAFTTTYSTGEPLAAATVNIYAPNDPLTPWYQGRTDAEGTFAFSPDPAIAGNWRIEVTQDGHQDILSIPVTADGVDYQNIVQGPQRDIHFAAPAAFTPELLGITAALGLGTVVFTLRRRQPSRP